jgi:hypothetical protein
MSGMFHGVRRDGHYGASNQGCACPIERSILTTPYERSNAAYILYH